MFVPVLLANGETLCDSTAILHYADRAGGAPPLFPQSVDAARVAFWEEL